MIILASQSPARKKILKNLGLTFKVFPSHIDEHHEGLKRPHAIAKRIAQRKAEAVSKEFPNDWVIAADTFVILKSGQWALKPKDKADARRIVKQYQGSYCDVYSGLAIINRAKKKQWVTFDKTRLYFRNFTDDEMEEYLKTDEWKNRSGAMTIEGRGGKWVKKQIGDTWNVVGVPVEKLKPYLKALEH